MRLFLAHLKDQNIWGKTIRSGIKNDTDFVILFQEPDDELSNTTKIHLTRSPGNYEIVEINNVIDENDFESQVIDAAKKYINENSKSTLELFFIGKSLKDVKEHQGSSIIRNVKGIAYHDTLQVSRKQLETIKDFTNEIQAGDQISFDLQQSDINEDIFDALSQLNSGSVTLSNDAAINEEKKGLIDENKIKKPKLPPAQERERSTKNSNRPNATGQQSKEKNSSSSQPKEKSVENAQNTEVSTKKENDTRGVVHPRKPIHPSEHNSGVEQLESAVFESKLVTNSFSQDFSDLQNVKAELVSALVDRFERHIRTYFIGKGIGEITLTSRQVINVIMLILKCPGREDFNESWGILEPSIPVYFSDDREYLDFYNESIHYEKTCTLLYEEDKWDY